MAIPQIAETAPIADARINPLALKKGMHYEQARPLILKAGWTPNLNGEKR
jgi:hypothetical protein